MENKITALPPYTIEVNSEDASNLIKLKQEIRKSIPNKADFCNLQRMDFSVSDVIRILGMLNTLNDFDNNTFTFSNLSDSNAIEAALLYRQFSIIEVRKKSHNEDYLSDLRNKGIALQGFEEILSKENNADITAIKYDRTLIVASNKHFSVKQHLMIFRFFHTIMSSEYSTPREEYPRLLDALLDNDLDTANNLISSLIESADIKNYKAKRLGDVFKLDKEDKIRDIKQRIENIRVTLENYERDYVNEYQRLETELDYLNYMENKSETIDPTQIGIYIMNNPYIEEAQQCNNYINVTYCAPLINLNPDAAEDAKKNRSDFAQKIIDTMLYHEDKYTLYTQCKLRVYNNLRTEVYRQSADYTQFIGQPHIDNHACYGNHIENIKNFADHMNVIGLFDQLTEMVMNMNFKDGIVTDDLMRELSDFPNLKTWKNNETGEFVSTTEIMEDLYGEA